MPLSDFFKYAITNDIFIDTALQNIPGMDVQRKFFSNPDVGVDTIAELWDYGGTEVTYTYTAEEGADYYIASDDNTDNQLVHVIFQDEDGYEYEVAVQMAGHTPVQINVLSNPFISANRRITDYKITRCYRFQNYDDSDFAGMVVITEGSNFVDGVPQDTTKVRASINNGNNKTLMCQYRIPTGFVGLFLWVYQSITRRQATTAEISIWLREKGKVFTIEDLVDINTLGTTSLERALIIPQIIPARTDITLKAIADAECGITGSYQVFLIKEEYAQRAAALLEDAAHVK